jgi:hypothetical protein
MKQVRSCAGAFEDDILYPYMHQFASLGTEFNDPRAVSGDLQNRGLSTWLDIERIKSGNFGLFESIAQVCGIGIAY